MGSGCSLGESFSESNIYQLISPDNCYLVDSLVMEANEITRIEARIIG